MQSIKVFGKNYKIRRVDCFVDPGEMGNCDFFGEINIRKSNDVDFENETILHEIVHCIDECMGLGLTEGQVTAISSGLFCIYRENHLHLIENQSRVN